MSLKTVADSYQGGKCRDLRSQRETDRALQSTFFPPKFCRAEEVLRVTKSLSFFSARVLKSHKADTIDEVFVTKMKIRHVQRICLPFRTAAS